MTMIVVPFTIQNDSGETVGNKETRVAPYEEDCYLCPRNMRVSGEISPRYEGVFTSTTIIRASAQRRHWIWRRRPASIRIVPLTD
mgnify:CR=1 FL=1